VVFNYLCSTPLTGRLVDQPMGEGSVAAKMAMRTIKMEGDVEMQQAATSIVGSDYHIVKVTREAHTFGKDKFIFKDKKGKLRSTIRDDRREITYNGQLT